MQFTSSCILSPFHSVSPSLASVPFLNNLNHIAYLHSFLLQISFLFKEFLSWCPCPQNRFLHFYYFQKLFDPCKIYTFDMFHKPVPRRASIIIFWTFLHHAFLQNTNYDCTCCVPMALPTFLSETKKTSGSYHKLCVN